MQVHSTHVKQVILCLLKLMQEHLPPVENQIVLLHCGMSAYGRPVDFSALAQMFQLASAGEAEAIYRAAVIKTRLAIPGSPLENWIVSYRMAYYPNRDPSLRVEPNMPVPCWTLGKSPLQKKDRCGSV